MIWKILVVGVLIIIGLFLLGRYLYRRAEKEWHDMIFG